MGKKPQDPVLGSLPHSRPHRRSDKRAARPRPPGAAHEPKAAAPAREPKATARPAREPKATARPAREPKTTAATAEPKQPASNSPTLPSGTELVGTVVKATAELAEIGITVGARAVRTALSRLPRP